MRVKGGEGERKTAREGERAKKRAIERDRKSKRERGKEKEPGKWRRQPTATLQHIATNSNTLRHTTPRCNNMFDTGLIFGIIVFLQSHATHCITLQLTATQCNTMHYNATQCNTLQHAATIWVTQASFSVLFVFSSLLQRPSANCNTPQRTASCCNKIWNTGIIFVLISFSRSTATHTATHGT